MILGLGALAVDDLLGVDPFPIAGQKMRVSWRRREGGGLAGTALAAAARLGAETQWVGTLGDDELSQWARAGLERDGVGTQFVREIPGARPHASVILVEDDGRRTVLSSREGVMEFPPSDIWAWKLDGVSAVFVDHTQVEAAIALVTQATMRGIPVIADIEREVPDLHHVLPLVTHFVAGLEFARKFTGNHEPAAVLRNLLYKHRTGRKCCAITAGEEGCWYWADEEAKHIPAFAVNAVDTTGCGDVFHGAFMAEIATGVSPKLALRFASAAAAIMATRVGGRDGLPTRDEVLRFMANAHVGS